MGQLRKQVTAWLLTLAVAASMHATPVLPEDLPEPPPLPAEMLGKRPLQPPPNLPDPSELFAQLKQLEELLSLPPEKLSRMRQSIEFIERMSTEEREAMRIRLAQITRSTPELQQEIRDLSALLPSTLSTGLSQFWLAASESDRDALRAQLDQLDQSARQKLLAERVRDFIERRDRVFAKMSQELEKRRAQIPPQKP